MTNFLKNRWVQGVVAAAVLGAVVFVVQGSGDTTTEETTEVTEVETTEVNSVNTSGTTETTETTEAVETVGNETTTEEITTDVAE